MKKYLLSFLFGFLIFFLSPQAVSAVYDLEVTGIGISPKIPPLNIEATITVTVRNDDGDTLYDLTGISTYDMDFTNFEVSSITLPEISPSKPILKDKTFKYVIKGMFNKLGTAKLTFLVNSEGALPERTLANNDRYTTVTVGPAYDLVAKSISSSMTGLRVGQETTITAKVLNNSYHDLNDNLGFRSFFYNFEDFIEKSKTIPSISLKNPVPKDKYAEYVFVGHFTKEGEKILNFTVDKEDQMEEFNEKNNDTETTITVGTTNDIDIAANTIALNKNADKYIVGDNIEIKFVVKNTGKISLLDGEGLLERDYGYSTGGDLRYDFPGIEITEINVPTYPEKDSPLNPGKTLSYTFKGEIKKAGSHTLSVDVDIHNDLVEKDEENNNYRKVVTAYKTLDDMYDFDISNISCDSISSTSLQISWRTDKESDGYVMYRSKDYGVYDRYMLTHDFDEWPKANDTMTHAVTLENLEPDTEYLYEIQAVNSTIEKEEGVFSCFTPENDQLKISNIDQTIYQNDRKIDIKWNTDFLASSYVYYKKKGASKYSFQGTDDPVKYHSITIEDLEAGDYKFYTYSETLVSSEAKSPVIVFNMDEIDIPDEPEVVPDNDSENKGDVGDTEDEEGGSDQNVIKVSNKTMYNSLRGKIILKVEAAGEAYYVNPGTQNMHYLGRPDDAFSVMREQGVGISNTNLTKIKIGLADLSGVDTDGDGLSDMFEDAIGTDKSKKDSDGDGFNDGNELKGGYNPLGKGNVVTDTNFANTHKGKIFLQVEGKGEAWYINPVDGKRYFLGRPADAFSVMRNLGLGISNSNFDSL